MPGAAGGDEAEAKPARKRARGKQPAASEPDLGLAKQAPTRKEKKAAAKKAGASMKRLD